MPEVKPHQHGTRTGYKNGCRESCCKAAKRDASRKDRESNPEGHRGYQRQYAITHAEAARKRAKAWREANPEQANETLRRWREANPKAMQRHRDKWSAANPEAAHRIVISQRRTRRARERDAFVEIVCPTAIFERDNWVCHICNEPVDPTLKHPHAMSASLDHIVPLSRGGEHSQGNAACSHLKCNRQKWAHV